MIRAYGHDSTCSGTYAEIGPTLTLNKSGEYTKGYYTITDTVPGNASGDYYVKAFSTFDDLVVSSGCVEVTVTPATVTMTFDAIEPYGAVDQWVNVWTHRYTITVNNATHAFTGTGVAQFGPGDVTEGTGETITGTLGEDSISYVATRTYDGRTWTLTNASYNTEVLAVTSPPVSWDIDMKITEPVLVP